MRSLHILIVSCGSTKVPNIVEMVHLTGMGAARVVSMEKMDERELAEIDGVIISGAPIILSDEDIPTYLSFFGWLEQVRVPILGICFGHQILGLLNGSSVFIGEEERLDTEIEILQQGLVLEGFGETAIFNQDHIEQITLPDGFIQTARSEKCEVEVMEHETEMIFGVQFHPETSGDNGRQVIENFLSLCID